MQEFLQTYGIWIVVGLLVLTMLVRRGRGMGGCCGGSHEHTPEKTATEVDNLEQPSSKRPGSGCH